MQERRGMGMRGGAALGGGGIVVALLVALLGGPEALQQYLGTQEESGGPVRPATEREKRATDFTSVVLASTEDVWGDIFSKMGSKYQPPSLVPFSDGVSSACGSASSAVGPFYCPADDTVYLDVTFFDELDRRFGAPGDFAQAYVIAHEVGHHVQNLFKTSERARAQQSRMSQAAANRVSVRLELQADCFAGIWAHHAERQRKWLDPGDLEEGLAAASAIGDDTLQKRARGSVMPESFTHGSSAQRVHWFKVGFESGRVDQCDTFRENAN